MSTGGEGVLLTTSNQSFGIMWSIKDHGKTWSSTRKVHPSGYRWLHDRFGSNFRMTEMQSAIGRIQLKRMKEWSDQRTRNAQILIDILRKCNVCRILSDFYLYMHGISFMLYPS